MCQIIGWCSQKRVPEHYNNIYHGIILISFKYSHYTSLIILLTYYVYYISNYILFLNVSVNYNNYSTIFVYHFSITPSLFPESLIHLKNKKYIISHHNVIVYNISTFLFKYYVIKFLIAIYLLIIVPFSYFVPFSFPLFGCM